MPGFAALQLARLTALAAAAAIAAPAGPSGAPPDPFPSSVAPTVASSAWPDLSQPPPRQGGGEDDTAVVVGIADYAFAPDVPGATANAEAWYRYLTVTRGIPVDRVRLLRDSEATLEEIRTAINGAATQGRSGSSLWFVFIGHGAPAKTGDDGLLIGADAQQTARSLEARSLRHNDLIAAVESSRARPVVVLDACFSGRTTDGDALAEGLQPLQVAQLGTPNAALVMTAARSNQYAGSLPGADRPAFSYLMLGALRGWGDRDHSGTVTAAEAVSYTDSALRTVVTGRSQTPEIRGRGTHSVLAKASEPGPDLAQIVVGGGVPRAQPLRPQLPPSQTDVAPPPPGKIKCIDNTNCPAPRACIDGTCVVDRGRLDAFGRKSRSLVIGGGTTLGVGGAAIVAGIAVAAPAELLSAQESAGYAVGLVGLAAAIAGAVVLGVGIKRRKTWRRYRGQAVRVAPRAGGVALRF